MISSGLKLIIVFFVFFLFILSNSANAQIQSNLSYENYLELIDKPKKQAIKQLDTIKQRFLSGDLASADLFVVVILTEESGKWEQVFIHVDRWNDGMIAGTLASEMGVVGGANFGDPFVFEIEHVTDWLIIHNNGFVEGNFIAQFLSKYQTLKQ